MSDAEVDAMREALCQPDCQELLSFLDEETATESATPVGGDADEGRTADK
jgi:hypothetical protein